MEVFRIEKSEHCSEFPPMGSLYTNGRWHTKGMWVVYTSESIALAKLEILANSARIPDNRVIRVIEVKDDAPLVEITADDLPDNWMSSPYPKTLARKIKAIIESQKFIGVIIPSAQSLREKNILLFPGFGKFDKYVKELDQFEENFDSRLK